MAAFPPAPPQMMPTAGALGARQQTRLNYLQKVRPNDPQVAQLQRLQGQPPRPQPPVMQGPQGDPGQIHTLPYRFPQGNPPLWAMPRGGMGQVPTPENGASIPNSPPSSEGPGGFWGNMNKLPHPPAENQGEVPGGMTPGGNGGVFGGSNPDFQNMMFQRYYGGY